MSRKSRRKFKKEMINRYYKKNWERLFKKMEEIKKNNKKWLILLYNIFGALKK